MKKFKYIIIIPVYKWPLTEPEAFSVYNNVETLKEYDFCWVGPDRLKKKFPCNILNKKLSFVSFPDYYFNSVNNYDLLLKSAFFYKKFSFYDYMLVAQTDSLALQNNIETWGNYEFSYIGAPWYEKFNTTKNNNLIGVGNGGFSLRKIADFNTFFKNNDSNLYSIIVNLFLKNKFFSAIKIFYKFKIFPSKKIHEDIFWGIIAPILSSNFKVANIERALEFSFEVSPEDMYVKSQKKIPFGCHAWEKYNKKFWINTLGHEFFRSNKYKIENLLK